MKERYLRPQSRHGLVRAAAVVTMLLIPGIASCNEEDPDCQPYDVYAQNRWELHHGEGDFGAGVWDGPGAEYSKHEQGIAPNEAVEVDGWFYTPPLYPDNPEGFRGEIWLRLADGSGWVNDGGVRGAETTPDYEGTSDDGGKPVYLDPACELSRDQI